MYKATTRSILVTVEPSFVEAESSPSDNRYFWAYSIEIVNKSEEVVRLRSRHWRITDANGRTEEVRGAGVVGKQPVLKPGEKFSYTSGCPLSTPRGSWSAATRCRTRRASSSRSRSPPSRSTCRASGGR